MSLLQPQSRNPFVLSAWMLLLAMVPGAYAQSEDAVIWLSLSDEAGNRVEVVAPVEGASWFVRHYEADHILVEEYVVEGNLAISGAFISPIKRLILDLEQASAFPDGFIPAGPGEAFITDTIGSGTPPGGTGEGGTTATTTPGGSGSSTGSSSTGM